MNTKATLLFSGMINDEIHENILWPELPYVTDEHGGGLLTFSTSMMIYNLYREATIFLSKFSMCWCLADIYFPVTDNEDILQTLASDSNVVVCIVLCFYAIICMVCLRFKLHAK